MATTNLPAESPLEGAVEPCERVYVDIRRNPETIDMTVTGDLTEESFADAVIQIEDAKA